MLSRHLNYRSKTIVVVLLLAVVVGCESENLPETAEPTSSLQTATPVDFPTPTLRTNSAEETATPEPLPTEPKQQAELGAAFGIRFDDRLPTELILMLETFTQENAEKFDRLMDRAAPDQPMITFEQNGERPIAEWLYTVAGPFATISDGTTLQAIQEGWQSGANDLGQLILDTDTAAVFTEKWGPPSEAIWVVSPSEISSALWAGRPAWTLLPFHQLTPEFKMLNIDQVSPTSPDFDISQWPLVADFGISGDAAAQDQFRFNWNGPNTNFDPESMTRVAMSGVTALGRATAYQMEIQGVTVPGEQVAPHMLGADISHVSHEVPFASDCPFPNPVGDPIFCARDKYLELITSIGTDVVELTGNHVNDWGAENLLYSLDLYRAAGIEVFGGGRDLVEAAQPALFEHNGNKIAFVGCNVVGPPYAWATDVRAGSSPCDLPAFYDQIRALKADGYLVISTLQYYEFYHYAATAEQRVDFRLVAEAGADAVSGSQGHHVQGFDFYKGAFIHHGLGNLFFDQMDMLGTRQNFIDIYTVYNGRIINVELVSSLIENYCCPRLMTVEERDQLLETVFEASGW